MDKGVSMTEEEIAKRFCKFESCTHRNGERTCCLYNQDNCIFHRLEKENAELKKQIEKMKSCEWQTGEPIKGREIFARNSRNCNLLATYFDGAWRNVWNGGVIDFDKITMWRYTGFKNNGETID